MTNHGWITTAIAVYGAFVGTAGLAWNIYREVTNRGRLKVTAYVADLHLGIGGPPIESGKLAFTVVNTGRRPIFVTQIGGGYGGQKFFMTPQPANEQRLPRKLEPGEAFTDASIGAAVLDDEHLKFLGAWDGENNIHRMRKKDFAQLVQQWRSSRDRRGTAAEKA